jgi:hypothetical protein
MNTLKTYRNTINTFIKKDFPSLRKEKIILKEKKANWRAHVSHSLQGLTIHVSEKLRSFPMKSIKRILFHELCHLEIFKKQGMIKTNLQFLAYLLSANARKKIEAEANILMIQKGHGQEVITAYMGNKKRGLPYALTLKEIKHYMKNTPNKSV